MQDQTIVKVVNDVIKDSGFKGLSAEIQDNMKTLLKHLKGSCDSVEKVVEQEKTESDITEDSKESKEDGVAHALLFGEGLNHSSFTRKLKGNDSVKSKEETRGTYNSILEEFKGKNVIHKQGHDWFFIKE